MGNHYVSMLKFRNESKVCENPHKGWYHHYYDNGLTNYGSLLEEGDFLEDFPGLNHLYLRLAWSHLEPVEREFHWDVIDRIIDPWVAKGYGIAFRVTCKETTRDQIYATPEWVKQAGAKGEYFSNPWSKGWQNWEPDYGDPVFLEKLENFHGAFAERYDNKPWVEYIDIGSYGDWGEGHTQVSSKKDWPVWVLKEHVELHMRHYKNSTLVINDDHIGCRYVDTDSKEELLQYFIEKNLGFRDDSVCVMLYQDNSTGYSTLRFPEYFNHFWRKQPVDLELDHYGDVIRGGIWRNGLPFLAAVEEAHATYIGFHGDARRFLKDNPDISKRLANRSGYWYTIKGLEVPDDMGAGGQATVTIEWQNLGVAPCYYKYATEFVLLGVDDPSIQSVQLMTSDDNRFWNPGDLSKETYQITIPMNISSGVYRLKVRLYEDRNGSIQPIELALNDEIRDTDGYYDLTDIHIR